MKIHGKVLLACCAFTPVNAFFVHQPNRFGGGRYTSIRMTDQPPIESTDDIEGGTEAYQNVEENPESDTSFESVQSEAYENIEANLNEENEEETVSEFPLDIVQQEQGSEAYENMSSSLAEVTNIADLEAQLDNLERVKEFQSDESRAYLNKGQRIWDRAQKINVQGNSLKTFSFPNPIVERVKVVLKSHGRPMNADIDLWHGPDNTPVKMRIYLEDGSERPFMTSIETPEGSNTIAVRNNGNLEFPLDAAVLGTGDADSPMDIPRAADVTIQGGALKTFPFDPLVQSVQVFLKTDGRPLNSRIELLQGPNNNKQVVELYTENGIIRPFYMVIETPGSGNVIRIQNTAPVEFPMTASVEPYHLRIDPEADFNPVIGGSSDWD